jgi:hypothetical protein
MIEMTICAIVNAIMAARYVSDVKVHSSSQPPRD